MRNSSLASTRFRRLSAAVLLLSLAVGLSVGSVTAQSITDQTEALAQGEVEITDLAPFVIDDLSDLVISGQFTNLSERTVAQGVLELRIGNVLLGRSQLTDFHEDAAIFTRAPVPLSVARQLSDTEPGETTPFEFTVPAERLTFNRSGVYPVKLSVIFEGQVIAQTFSVVPVLLDPTTNFAYSVLWPITAPPAQLDTKTAYTDLLPDSLLPEGSVNAILDSHAPSFALLVDPSTVDFANQAQNDYLISDGSAVKVGTDSNAIKGWLDSFARSRTTAETWVVPYANPELLTNKGARLSNLQKQSFRASERAIATELQGAEGVVSILEGNFSSQQLEGLAGVSEVIIVPSRLLAQSPQSNFTQNANTSWSALQLADQPAPLLIADSQLTEAFSLASSKSSLPSRASTPKTRALWVRQQLASTLTMLALERPSEKLQAVVVPPTDWSPTPIEARAATLALTQGAWANVVSLRTIMASVPSEVAYTNASPVPPKKGATLRPRQLDLIRSGVTQLERVAAVTVLPSPLLTELELGLSRSLSKTWIKRGKIGRGLAELIDARIDDAYSSLAVVAAPELTLTGQLGALPVTIANGLDVPVRLNLTASSTLGAQLDLTTAQNIVIDGGQSANLDIPIELQGSVPTQITLYLTDDQQRPLGTGAVVRIQTTAYSEIARWISIVSLVLLVVFASFSLSRKMRKRRL